MEIISIRTSQGRPSIEKFFMDYFYADYLEDPSDIGAALDEYLESEKNEDPGGKTLLADTKTLLARHLTDQELAELIESWEPNAFLSLSGISYKPALKQICERLSGSA